MFVGLFIVLPCIESYKKVDLRTITLGVPPQEVRDCLVSVSLTSPHLIPIAAADKGQRDGVSRRRGLLPRVQRHRQRDKCEGHSSQHKVGFWRISLNFL